jgi:nucleoside-diphosphate-sugar epimerase
MRVFVAGVTGAIGSHAVPALVRAGHDVTALARTPEKAAVLRQRGATPLTVSIFDRLALRNAFVNHDAVAGARHSEQFLALARRRVCVMMGPPNTYVSSIHVADGGTAVAAALAVPAGIYNIVDDEPLTKRAYADALGAAAEKSVYVRLPGRLALLLGNRSTSLTRSLRGRNTRFRQASGWAPPYPSAREAWIATARALGFSP